MFNENIFSKQEFGKLQPSYNLNSNNDEIYKFVLQKNLFTDCVNDLDSIDKLNHTNNYEDKIVSNIKYKHYNNPILNEFSKNKNLANILGGDISPYRSLKKERKKINFSEYSGINKNVEEIKINKKKDLKRVNLNVITQIPINIQNKNDKDRNSLKFNLNNKTIVKKPTPIQDNEKEHNNLSTLEDSFYENFYQSIKKANNKIKKINFEKLEENNLSQSNNNNKKKHSFQIPLETTIQNSTIKNKNDLTPKSALRNKNDLTPKSALRNRNDLTPKSALRNRNDLTPKSALRNRDDVNIQNSFLPSPQNNNKKIIRNFNEISSDLNESNFYLYTNNNSKPITPIAKNSGFNLNNLQRNSNSNFNLDKTPHKTPKTPGSPKKRDLSSMKFLKELDRKSSNKIIFIDKQYENEFALDKSIKNIPLSKNIHRNSNNTENGKKNVKINHNYPNIPKIPSDKNNSFISKASSINSKDNQSSIQLPDINSSEYENNIIHTENNIVSKNKKKSKGFFCCLPFCK